MGMRDNWWDRWGVRALMVVITMGGLWSFVGLVVSLARKLAQIVMGILS